MKRNITRLSTTTFDLVVIGAGIYGAAISRVLARHGYLTALIDKGDFCQATSANSLKILHGGLRYLQHLNLKRMRESIVCRRELMQFSPHLVQPLSCLMPTRGRRTRSKAVMATAFALNDAISYDRNAGLPTELHLPRGRIMSKHAFAAILPELPPESATGAANWYDGLAENTERMAIEHILDAAEYGACPANYVQAEEILFNDNTVTGVLATDRQTGKTLTIATRLVINAAGPWFTRLLQQSGVPCPQVDWAKAINLVVKKQLHPKYAIGLESREEYQDKDAVFKRGKRLYFFVPWRGYTMIGTTYKPFHRPADEFSVEQQDIDEILDEVNAIYPNYRLSPNDVTFVHSGLVPMSEAPTDTDDVQIEKNSQIIDHGQADGPSGLISVKGIKYTTAPHAARELLRMVRNRFSPSPTRQPASKNDNVAEKNIIPDRLQKKYGRFADAVMPFITKEDGDRPVCDGLDLTCGEVQYYIQEEMALTLSDVILRRSDLGTAQCPDTKLLEALAAYMARQLHWDNEEQNRQLDSVRTFYAPLSNND